MAGFRLVTLTFRFGAANNGHSAQFRAVLTPGSAAFRLRFDGVVFDNCELPLRPPRLSPWHLLLHVEAGSIRWNERELGPGSTLLAPESVVLPSDRVTTELRTHAGPVSILAMRLPSAAVARDHGETELIAGGHGLDEALAPVARLLSLETAPPQPDVEMAFDDVWRSLCESQRVVGRAPVCRADERTASAERRVSEALSLGLSQLELNPQLIDLIAQARVTERQLLRDIVAVQSRFGFVLRGWRDTLNWWRLVAATLFLGAPELSVGEVAATVGFASTTTMARAFRNAGLAQPSAVRARLRA